MRLSRGVLLITQTRMASRVINRLRPPSDGDILVPGGSVSILGTTSVQVESPEHAFPTLPEVDINLKEGLALVPRLATTPFLRAYAGIRPLIQAAGAGDARKLSRDFLLDTHEQEGLDNLLTLTGGKLTTYRLMAERAADLLCARLGIHAACRTAELPLRPSRLAKWTDPGPANKYGWWNRHTPGDSLMCECEIIPQEAVDGILPELRDPDFPLLDISNRSRLGKGACQGTFCAARLTAYLHDRDLVGGERGRDGLKSFLQERWKGQRPILWGAQCAQAELKEALYLGFLRLGE